MIKMAPIESSNWKSVFTQIKSMIPQEPIKFKELTVKSMKRSMSKKNGGYGLGIWN